MDVFLAADLLAPHAGLIFWKALTFLLLLYVLYKFAWGPITNALEEREETIDSSIKRAEKALAEAKQIQADNEKARREAEQKAQQIMREARESAETLRAEERESVRAEIQQMRDQAQQEIEREKQSALDELRAEVADLAIQAAEKILDENLDAKRQHKLVDKFIGGLHSN